MADTNGNPSVPEQVYHTTLTVVDYHRDTAGSIRDVYVLGTHTTLEAAKAFALEALEQQLGYSPSDFVEYATRANSTPPENWKHGDGVMVYAKLKPPMNHEFLVGLDTKPNTESLPADPNNRDTLQLPAGHDNLHYVLQTQTDYNQDNNNSLRSPGSGPGSFQTTSIQGCYARRADALAAARAVLQKEDGDRETATTEYAQYDDRDDAQSEGEWPFGEDVVVHAVAQTGENYTVAVKTAPGAHRKHGRASCKMDTMKGRSGNTGLAKCYPGQYEAD
ncbi:hypothetical protein N657DRAFT_154701 [Parathielavia appendiculata]|uniref:Uncharacterized protein n=1 Tax=Parathielavia appendiculata TaxID=2587402 RepID=A0AAN6TTI8_9PEZI|nr:hypothetical protein N657DRAFT_154701 [Parathielavia appendiculata]